MQRSAAWVCDMAPRRLDPDRLSVQTYDEAREWLWTHSRVEDWLWDAQAPLPPEAQLVCAFFWVSPSHLVRDLKQDVAGFYQADPRHRRTGWRR